MKQHFKFTYTLLSPDATGPRYALVARPDAFASTGVRSLFIDQTGTLRYTSDDREPTDKDPVLQ